MKVKSNYGVSAPSNVAFSSSLYPDHEKLGMALEPFDNGLSGIVSNGASTADNCGQSWENVRFMGREMLMDGLL